MLGNSHLTVIDTILVHLCHIGLCAFNLKSKFNMGIISLRIDKDKSHTVL